RTPVDSAVRRPRATWPLPVRLDRNFQVGLKQVVCPSFDFPQADGRKPVMALPYRLGATSRRDANDQVGVVRATEEYEPRSWSCRSLLIGHSRIGATPRRATRSYSHATRQIARAARRTGRIVTL